MFILKGMKTLFAGFKGENNSSKLLLDALSSVSEKLYLTNSYKTSVSELTDRLMTNKYDQALIFGQWSRVAAGAVRLEAVAKKGRYRRLTTFPYRRYAAALRKQGLDVVLSEYAGNWLCNNVYFYGLKAVTEQSLRTKVLFVHLPKARQVADFWELAGMLEHGLEEV